MAACPHAPAVRAVEQDIEALASEARQHERRLTSCRPDRTPSLKLFTEGPGIPSLLSPKDRFVPSQRRRKPYRGVNGPYREASVPTAVSASVVRLPQLAILPGRDESRSSTMPMRTAVSFSITASVSRIASSMASRMSAIRLLAGLRCSLISNARRSRQARRCMTG